MYITETERIGAMIEAQAKSGMTMEQIIRLEVDAWQASPVREEMLTGWRYYRNEMEVKYVKEDGIQVKNAFVRKIAKQKVDYLLSKPFSIRAKNDAYLELLNGFVVKELRKKIKMLGTEAVNKGIAWLQVYFSDNRLAFQVIPSEEIVPLWRDSAHTELDGVIRVYFIDEYSGMQKTRVKHVEYWCVDGVYRYVYSPSGLVPDVELGAHDSHFTMNGVNYNWERVPFIAWRYNDDELPLIRLLKSPVDDYNTQKSIMANLLKDIPNFIYVLKNYGGQDLKEFLSDLAEYNAIKCDDGDGGVDKLQADFDIAAYDTYQQQARKDIYEFGRGVDTQAVDLGNASGEALKFRYADLDADCNDMETEFANAFNNLVWFADQFFAMSGKGNFADEDVDIIFNRDIIIVESEVIDQYNKSTEEGISRKTALANHPWVTDVEEEMRQIELEQQEKAKQQKELFGVVENTPPDGEGNEE